MDPITGTALAVTTGASLYGAFGPKKGINYGYLDNLYSQRKGQIADFQSQLQAARTRYLSSLNNMYAQSYGRFSQNAEAGFANRGLAVNGGAFASALAKKSADYQAQLEPLAYQAEREDINAVDNAYGQAANMYAGGRAGGAGMEYQANRADSGAFGGLMSNLTMFGLRGGFSGDKAPSPEMASYGLGRTNGYSPFGSPGSSYGRVGRGKLDLWGA